MIDSPLLPQTTGCIAGRWTWAHTGETARVINPATGEHLADVPMMREAEARDAVRAAAASLHEHPTIESRQQQLRAIGDAIMAHKQEIGRIITLENGKPLAEGVGEAEYAAGFFHYFAGVVSQLDPHTLPQRARGCEWTVHHRPAGVVGIITPWNFPLAMMAKKISAAIGAGCACVVKPAQRTPLAAVALWHLFEQIGMQPGRCNLVIGDSKSIGSVLCTEPVVRLVSFTGSTSVGRTLSKQAAPHLKRMSLELGGNAPFLVFADADLEAAADGLIANKFRAGGQTCVCANRVYVHADVHDRFVEVLTPKVAALRVGNGLDDGVDIGPLINRDGWAKVHEHVGDALSKGAQRVAGDEPSPPAQDFAAFYPPTVLVGVRPDMLVCREETFGPVIPIGVFDSESQAVELANQTDAGLAAYLYTRDPRLAERVAAQLQFGHVGVNTGTGPAPHAPFGGMKQSGFGREGGLEGLLEYTEPQVVPRG